MGLELDPRAFFTEFYPRVYRFVWSRTRASHVDVEELVQDVLFHAWRDRAQFRGDSDPASWILSIARHRILGFRRGQDRGGRAIEVLRALQASHRAPIPEEILGASETRARVWGALERLEKEHAEVLIRRYVEDQSVRQIAEDRGESEKAVESRLHRAREAFRKALEHGVETNEPS